MSLIELFDPFGHFPSMDREWASVEEFVAEWQRLGPHATGRWYVYAFRDADGSVFYVGKGTGDRAHDAKHHHHGRLGYYVAKMLTAPYTVEMLASNLSADDAELLEALLIQKFGRQLVNWAGRVEVDETDEGKHPAPSLPTYAEAREKGQALRARARATAKQNQEHAVSVCREALAYLSDWERANAEAETRELERRAAVDLGARVDLHEARNARVASPPVPACDILSDLTIYLCRLGRAEEARREVDTFSERYPHVFREYDEFDRRLGQTMRVPVGPREEATLRRVDRALKGAPPKAPNG